MSAEKEVYIIVHESVLASWLKDVGSLGTLAALVYVNHTYGAGSAFVDAFAVLLLIGYWMTQAAYFTKKRLRFTREELRIWALDSTAPTVR